MDPFPHLLMGATSNCSPHCTRLSFKESHVKASNEGRSQGPHIHAGTLAKTLDAHGFKLSRLKTGTPPRIDARTVDFGGMERQPTDNEPIPFSFLNMADSAWTPPAQQACL